MKEYFISDFLSMFNIDIDINKIYNNGKYNTLSVFLNSLLKAKFINNSNLQSAIYEKKDNVLIKRATSIQGVHYIYYINEEVSLKDAIDILHKNDIKLRKVIEQIRT